MSAHADHSRTIDTIERKHERHSARVEKRQQARSADYAFKRFVANHNAQQGC